MSLNAGIALSAQSSVSPAKTELQRKQLLEQQQIARMILSLQQCREDLASYKTENEKKDKLIANLDRQIANITQQAEEHKKNSEDREKALKIKEEIEASYKASLADAKKEIDKLNRRVGLWQKIAFGAFVVGAGLGVLATRN